MIIVLAGVNGAGKSSVLGSTFRANGDDYFNPDEETRAQLAAFPKADPERVASLVWQQGVERLRQALQHDQPLIIETTLGGKTISGLLSDGMDRGAAVTLIYCGLSSPDLHIQRVRERVARGGHDIPEQKVRQRWERSIVNAVHLAPRCAEVLVYDNSRPLDRAGRPAPRLLLTYERGIGTLHVPVSELPDWVKPLAVALDCV